MTDLRRRLGFDDTWAAEAAGRPGHVGRVVRQDRGWVQVATEDGVVAAESRTDRTGAPVVGDWVVVDGGVVTAVLPRRSALRRADPAGGGEQVLAANVDLVLVVLGLDRPVKRGRIQRSVTQARDAGAEAVVVLTKSDLVPGPDDARDHVTADHPGLDVFVVSSRTGAGLDALEPRLAGLTVVLLGESGAGKSSLVNALAGDDLAGTGAVRDFDGKGRHTTTRRELHLLDDGTIVIDTPGLRSLGLAADLEALGATFPEIEALASGCRFGNCSHSHEPGCAVRDAVAGGELPSERLDDYLALAAEIASGPAVVGRRSPRAPGRAR